MPKDLFLPQNMEQENNPIDIFAKENIQMPSAAENLTRLGQEQIAKPHSLFERTPQMQEEYSNPTISPNFKNLSDEEKQQRIAFSLFDPANQTPEGKFVPGGTYEHPITRLAANIIPTIAAPEISGGSRLLGRFLGAPLVNALSRIGTGTAGNMSFALPEIKNKEDFINTLKETGKLNTLLELATWFGRIPKGMGELRNPIAFGKNKVNEIRNEATATGSAMKKMYEPVNIKYNNSRITDNAKDYLNNAGIKRPLLFKNAQIAYDDFLQKPTFGNLHNLQSTIGKDWARISKSPASEGRAQQFSFMRDNLTNKAKDFLSMDKEALNQYKNATNYAANVHYPYLSTPTLRNIAKTKYVEDIDTHPKDLAKSIKKATRKTIGKEERSVIPLDHPLRNHLKELNRVVESSQLPEQFIPKIIRENMLNLPATLQLPGIENVIKNHLSPYYYGGGRAAIGLEGNNKE